MMPKVFVSRIIPDAGLNRIREVATCDVWTQPLPPPYEVLVERACGCDGVLTLLSDRIDDAFFEAVGPQLKVVSNFAVGYNNIDVLAADRRNVAVGNTPGVLTDSTADLAVALLLAAARCMKEAIENVAEHRWETWEPMGFIGQDLKGKTLGIVGMGRIGAAVARRMHFGWEMPVLYCSRSPKPDVDEALEAQRVEFEHLLERCDFISIHTDLNPKTEKLIDAIALERVKPSCVMVNTARGGVVDEAALFQALSTGKLFAAGLDVTDPEPLDAESPLRALPNCVILPHIASATVSSRNAMAEIAADNLIAGIQGLPLRHAVQP